ncbi:MAG: hypothetical protein H6868_07595 [Rhodospirillales bacterium]|nr:hypothetical protein [Rhodospirillales bacterium]
MENTLQNKAEEIIQLLMQQNELLEKLLEKKGCGCGDNGGCCKDESKEACVDEDEGSCCGGGCH